MNPYFLGEARPAEKPLEMLGQVASLEILRGRRMRLTLDAVPFDWAQQQLQEGSDEPNPEAISRFFETAPFFHIRATLSPPVSLYVLAYLLFYATGDESDPRDFLGRWLRVCFEPEQGGNATCYSSVSDPGTIGTISIIDPAPKDLILYLNKFTPSVTEVTYNNPELKGVLDSIPRPHLMAVLDVGQGSANVMLSRELKPLLYFDVGHGVRSNLGTTPPGLKFCTCPHGTTPVPVLLSHWHEDHYLGTKSDPDLLNCTWITPTAVTAKQMSFQNSILAAGSKVYQLLPFTGTFQFGAFGNYTLAKCTGKVNNPNESGYALEVKRRCMRWLLPADASYVNIPLPMEKCFAAVVATHHGGRFKKNLVPHKAFGYARLVYSFGPNNSYHHPKAASVTKHSAQWNHGTWTGAATPGVTPPGSTSDVRVTAIHGVLPTHAGAIAIGWIAPPALAGLAGPCPTCGKSFNILQN